MALVLNLGSALHDDLQAHLLPQGSSREQAAFLLCTSTTHGLRTEFDVLEAVLLQHNSFVAQEDDYLELADEARIALIKRGHALGACLVELHSHPAPWPAAFSRVDRRGLSETVPHMRWRMKGRPYIAIVVAPGSFDALVWHDDTGVPEPLDGIQVGETLLAPTNRSLEGWGDEF